MRAADDPNPAVQRAVLLRRYCTADRRRRVDRYDHANRDSSDNAQLRRLHGSGRNAPDEIAEAGIAVRLILLGPPGAGKGTQARALGALWNIPQIASGDLLRAAVRDGGKLGLEAQSFMDRGQLVPDELVLKLIAERLKNQDAQAGFILDGFPRSVPQAEALAGMISRIDGPIDKVVA